MMKAYVVASAILLVIYGL